MATLFQASSGVGALPARVRPQWPGARVHGPAWTVRVPRGDNLALHRAIEAAPAGAVLVAAPAGGPFAYWGELMTRAAVERGLGGLVLDGGVRDAAEIEAVGFPVFADGAALRSTGKRIPGASVGSGRTGRSGTRPPLVFGATWVSDGDLVAADRDGAVVVPRARVDAVLTAARARDSEEARVQRELRAGARLLDLLSEGRPDHE